MSSLSILIREKASEIGFHKVGFVAGDALDGPAAKLQAWLAREFHGEMAWMAREPEKRVDPRILFPPTRSIIVAALNYYTPHQHELAPGKGKISRYAWGDDYHDVMREKLTQLVDWLRFREPSVQTKICIDTSPFMDKAWAVKAGLGWLGKHSNLITPQIGSWVFLGSVLVDIELECDTQLIEDHCGTCTACLDACPTGAIVQPYVVDSRRCLSYATIELRGDELPDEISPRMQGWLYGCDICQDVCPWNRFETPSKEPRFEPRNGETSLDLKEVRAMTHEEYAPRFRHSAIKRTKLAGLKRNARALESVQLSDADEER